MQIALPPMLGRDRCRPNRFDPAAPTRCPQMPGAAASSARARSGAVFRSSSFGGLALRSGCPFGALMTSHLRWLPRKPLGDRPACTDRDQRRARPAARPRWAKSAKAVRCARSAAVAFSKMTPLIASSRVDFPCSLGPTKMLTPSPMPSTRTGPTNLRKLRSSERADLHRFDASAQRCSR